jgi:hypothetical protein
MNTTTTTTHPADEVPIFAVRASLSGSSLQIKFGERDAISSTHTGASEASAYLDAVGEWLRSPAFVTALRRGTADVLAAREAAR